MASVGPGVREVRVREEGRGLPGALRHPDRGEAVYVLHAFQKKTQRTAKSDRDLAAARLRQIERRR